MSINRHEPSKTNNQQPPVNHFNGHNTENGSNHSGSTSSLNSVGTGASAAYGVGAQPQSYQYAAVTTNHHLPSAAVNPKLQQHMAIGASQSPPLPPPPLQQNCSIPSNAIHTPATAIHHISKHVRSRSAVEPLISYGLVPSQATSTSSHHLHPSSAVSSHHLHQLNKNSVSSLTSVIPSPSLNVASLSFLSSIEEKVARLFYRHGLFCARHSLAVIFTSLLLVSIASYPIVTFSGLFGSSSEVYVTSSNAEYRPQQANFASPTSKSPFHHRHDAEKSHPISNTLLLQTGTDSFLKHVTFWKNGADDSVNSQTYLSHNVPRWFQGNLSYAYVQQIYVRSAVIPWTADMQLVDALRGPFDVLFELIESISNYQQRNNDTGQDITLADLCLQVFEPSLSRRYRALATHLPSYSCLMLSPANIWRDSSRFRQDTDFLSTLLKFKDTTASPLPVGTLHNLFFGVHFDETGIRRSYGRNRQRTVTYAITIVLRHNVPAFIDGLREFLLSRFPPSGQYYHTERSHSKEEEFAGEEDVPYQASMETLHVFFHSTFTFAYLIPLFLFYASFCLYFYFSVRKIEIVRNRLLYPFCALLTVLMSVFMSFGICFRLNFNSVLIVNRLLPYFVAFVSFENMLVLTKSFLAQYPYLDTKVRVAQGLSWDGLGITKNLLAELTLLLFGSFLFTPFFQECCIFAAVCLLSDFFIQVTFFTSFISLNIQPINERSIKKKSSKEQYFDRPYPKNIYAQPGKPELRKTPKRLRIIYFFARIRVIQRGFILLLMACIGLAIYNAYLVLEQAPQVDDLRPAVANSSKGKWQSSVLSSSSSPRPPIVSPNDSPATPSAPKADDGTSLPHHSLIDLLKSSSAHESNLSSPTAASSFSSSSSGSHSHPYGRIRFTYEHPVSSMPNHHWSNLFSLYNVSLTGRFLSILPPIMLSIPVSPERAQSIRNLADADDDMLRKFVPMKFANGEYVIVDDDFDEYETIGRQHFFSNWSRTDLYITFALSIPSFIFLVYIFILMYRCVCTRNYAEWRTQLSTSLTQQWNFLDHFSIIFKRITFRGGGRSLGTGYQRLAQMEHFLHFDIRMLTIDRESEPYQNERQFLLNNQDIDQIATGAQSSLVATSSMSGDIRVFDALTCETLTNIKRSKTSNGICHSPVTDCTSQPSLTQNTTLRPRLNSFSPVSVSTPSHSNNSVAPSPVLIARTSGNLLRTIVDGISVEDDNADENLSVSPTGEPEVSSLGSLDFQPVWCLGIFDRYILAGCGTDGRLEVWDAYTGELTHVHQADHHDLSDQQSASITAMRVTFWGVALARINGTLDLLEADQRKEVKYAAGSSSRLSSHTTASSSFSNGNVLETQFSIKYRLKDTIQAHQQPITRMEIIDSLEDEDFLKTFGARGCLITGSLDNTLKVFSLDQDKFMYTLNGHCGGISTTSIDQYSTATALSGCQLGQLFVWDLNTGTCIFSMQAHSQAEVLAITASQLYYVSSGTDNRICIWDRYSGHLVHQISQQHSNCRNMMFLESNILITVRDSELVVWDVNDAERPLCIVSPNTSKAKESNGGGGGAGKGAAAGVGGASGRNDFDSMIRSYQTAAIQRLAFAVQRKALICDYGNSLCVINNPFATKKLD